MTACSEIARSNDHPGDGAWCEAMMMRAAMVLQDEERVRQWLPKLQESLGAPSLTDVVRGTLTLRVRKIRVWQAVREGRVADARRLVDELEAVDASKFTFSDKEMYLGNVRSTVAASEGNTDAALAAIRHPLDHCAARYMRMEVFRIAGDKERRTEELQALADLECNSIMGELHQLLGWIELAELHIAGGETQKAAELVGRIDEVAPRLDVDLPSADRLKQVRSSL